MCDTVCRPVHTDISVSQLNGKLFLQLIAKKKKKAFCLSLISPDIVIFLSLQISEGLSFLHSGVKMVHGNLCPENIILNKSGAWKIMGFDFSISSTNPSDAEVCWKTFVPLVQSVRQGLLPSRCSTKIMSSSIVTHLCSLVLFSLSTHVKSGSPIFLHSASPTPSTWPLSTSCLSAATPPPTCTRWAWSCMPSSMRASLFSKSTSTTSLRASAGNWTRWVEGVPNVGA